MYVQELKKYQQMLNAAKAYLEKSRKIIISSKDDVPIKILKFK